MTHLQLPALPRSLMAARSARALAMIAVVVCSGYRTPLVRGQMNGPIQLSEAETPSPKEKEEKVEKTPGTWQTEVQEQLAEAEARRQKIVEESDRGPSPSLIRQIDLLKRLDLTLSQLVVEMEKLKKTESRLDQAQADLRTFLETDFDASTRVSFLEFDQAHDEWQAEQRSLQRDTEALEAARVELENARQELNERGSARRLAKEKLDSNNTDAMRASLEARHTEAKLLFELAEAVLRLREEEFSEAKLAQETQQLRTKMAEERQARIRSVVSFSASDLEKLLVELDQESKALESTIAELETSGQEIKGREEEQWLEAQRQLDSSAGNENEIREKLAAHELRLRVLHEEPSLLREQHDRLARQRDLWSHRQQVFSELADRNQRRDWEIDTEEVLAQLNSKLNAQENDILELRELLKKANERLVEAPGQSPEANWLQSQIESLERLLNAHEQNLNSIQDSRQLHLKLRDELEGDSLAASAKNRLVDVWHALGSIWTYEITEFDDQSVTVQKVVTALLIVMAGFVFSRILSRWMGNQVLRRFKIDPSATATFQSLFYYLLLVLFVLFALKVVKVPLTAFTVLGGAIALGVGFGSQNIINNFISGLILLAERPIKVGDLIKLEDLYGNIEHIGARSTRVRTGSNLDIIVPNSSFLQDKLINFTLSSDKVRTMVKVGVVYGSPTITVTQLLRRAVVETGRVAKDPPPIILFTDFGDNSLVFEVHFWVRMRAMMDQLQIESAVRYRIEQLFHEEGIVIAFPQRDVHLDTSAPLEVHLAQPGNSNSDSKMV